MKKVTVRLPKLWKLSEEINDTFSSAQGMRDLRDKYIEKVFGYRKAAKAAKEYQTLINKAWRMVRELHPDAPDRMRWESDRGGVVAVEESP